MLRISFYNWYNLHNIIRKHINLIDFVRYKNITSSNTSNIYKQLGYPNEKFTPME